MQGECYAAAPLIVALSSSRNYITRFRPWSTIETENRLDGTEKITNIAQKIGIVDVYNPRSGISALTARRATACPKLHE